MSEEERRAARAADAERKRKKRQEDSLEKKEGVRKQNRTQHQASRRAEGGYSRYRATIEKSTRLRQADPPDGEELIFHERDAINALLMVISWHKSMRKKVSRDHNIDPPLPELTYSTTRAEQLFNIGKQRDSYSCGVIASALACYWMLHRYIPQQTTFSASTQICEDFRIYMAHVILGERDKVPQQFTLHPTQPTSITIEEHNNQQAILNDCAARRELQNE